MTPNPYKQILSEIRAHRFAPVYLLSGEEPYYLDLIADALQRHVLNDDERDFNQHIFYGQDVDLDVVINTARQFPIMAEHKLIMIREAQGMQAAKSKLEKLESYIEQYCPTSILVIHYKGEPFKESSRIVKAIRKIKGVNYLSPKTRDYEVSSHLRDYCADHNVNIEPKGAEMLIQSVGANLQILFGEIEKLRLSLPEADRVSITADMVAANIGVSKQYNNFELKSAITRRDYATCIKIARYYAANPNGKECSPEMTASTLFTTFANIISYHYLKDKSDNSIRENLKISFRPQIEELRNGARNYTAWSCLRIIHAIRIYDRELKGIGSSQPRSQMLIDLIYKIFTL